MLDRHLILKHSSGAISNEFSGFDQSSVLATPPSIKQAKAVFPQDGAASKLQSTNQHPNSRLRSNSAYSEQLEPLEAKWKQRLDNVEANKIVKNDKIQTLSKFNTLLTELRKTTDGGNQHYQALLTSIVVNFDPTHDTYIAISAAKARWEAARNEMIVYLEKKIAEIDSFASTEQVSLP
jgi:hypothetical protein